MKNIWQKNVNRSITPYLKSSYEKCRSYKRFKFLKKAIAKRIESGGDFLDIGCGKGEFIWYLKDSFPKVNFTGLDISKELISLAKRMPDLKDALFVRADAETFDLNRQFDFVLMNGVLSIFDDYKKAIKRMLKHMKSEGWGYIFGCFAEDDADVLIRYRNNFTGSRIWESGLNMFSLNTMTKSLKPFSSFIKCRKFNLPIDIPRTKDPVRSYTLNTKEEGRIVLTGLNIKLDLYLIEFRKRR